ncbi:MAG: efflux RND transporter periplasmic adaptor subunit [Candidatus Omnitrophica bacterium]|nr:efflux RND transporter periplasmic adaptor subunit [Candidatus Omnitrophota bacterium]
MKKWPILHNKIFLGFIVILVLFLVMTVFKKSKIHETFEVKKGDILESVYGIGTVKANKSYQIKSGVTATISKILVKEGDKVKAADKLLVLDDNTVFTAPFDGVVTSLPYKAGETVFAQTGILNLVDLNDRYLLVSLEQRGALKVKVGQEAFLSFDGLRDRSFKGVVDAVYSNDADFLVRIDAAKLPLEILPGMTADVAITISIHHNSIVVPITSLNDNKVNLVDGTGQRKTVDVQLGLVDSEMAEIVSHNIHVGDKLLIRSKGKP